MTMDEISFPLTGESIELCKLLKVCGLLESGGASKFAIKSSLVKVDGTIETRKAFKVRRGQRVEYKGQFVDVV